MTSAIVLIGPMGAGKSEVGAVLSQRLGRPFVDTDEIVERDAGSSISAIFEREGEPGFRDREVAAVRKAADIPGAIIACGGGAVLKSENVERLRSAGRVVYLKVDAATAAERVIAHGSRPLLAGHDPKARLAELIQARESFYQAAADHVVGADGSVDEVVERVLEAIER